MADSKLVTVNPEKALIKQRASAIGNSVADFLNEAHTYVLNTFKSYPLEIDNITTERFDFLNKGDCQD